MGKKNRIKKWSKAAPEYSFADQIQESLSTTFAFSSLGFATNSFGLIRPSLSLFFATLFLFLSLLILRRVKQLESSLAMVVAVSLLPLFFAGWGHQFYAGSSGVLLCSLCLINPKYFRLKQWARDLLLAYTSCIVLYLALITFPFVWSLANSVCIGLSKFVNGFFYDSAFVHGEAYFALPVSIFGALILSSRWKSLTSRSIAFATTCFLFLALTQGYLSLLGALRELFEGRPAQSAKWGFFDAAGIHGEYKGFFSYMIPHRMNLLHGLAIFPISLVVLGRIPLEARLPIFSFGNFRLRPYGLSSLLLVLMAGCLYPGSTAAERRERFLIWDPGKGLTRSTQQTFDRGGFLSSLVVFSQNYFQTEVIEKESDLMSLGSKDILVIVNLQKSFPTAVEDKIQSFVKNGGALLCLGDHTGNEAIRLPFNQLLEPYGIEFNFDSCRAVKDWRSTLIQFNDACRVPAYPLPNRIRSAGIGTGASLTVRGSARPLMVARYAYSDPGNINRPDSGYLGNLNYDYGEPLGDMILAAEGFGAKGGKVLVFGDTSPFQNGAIPVAANFLENVFDYLSNSAGPRLVLSNAMLFFAGFVLVSSSLFDLGGKHWYVAGAGFAIFGLSLAATDRSRGLKQPLSKPVVLDQRFGSNLTPWSNTKCGTGGYEQACLHVGRPLIASFADPDTERVVKGETRILSGIQRTLSKREANNYVQFVERGGELMVLAGHPEESAVRPLLEEFGVSIGDTPLGQHISKATIGKHELDIEFFSAWPLETELGTTICKSWGAPTVVRVPRGKGSMVVVGDGRFFQEQNCYGPRKIYKPANAQFLELLLGSKTIPLPEEEKNAESQTIEDTDQDNPKAEGLESENLQDPDSANSATDPAKDMANDVSETKVANDATEVTNDALETKTQSADEDSPNSETQEEASEGQNKADANSVLQNNGTEQKKEEIE